jgi:hypothetical protein
MYIRSSGPVWFVPKIALPKFWLANILVELFLAHKLANIGYKNELDLVVEHWQAKKLATIQTRTNLLVMTKKIGRVCFGSNPNRPCFSVLQPKCSTLLHETKVSYSLRLVP